jgi:hypothetical protein
VLQQLRSSNRKRQNRKREEILRYSTVDSWHFISSADNPACVWEGLPIDFRDSCATQFFLRNPTVRNLRNPTKGRGRNRVGNQHKQNKRQIIGLPPARRSNLKDDSKTKAAESSHA